MSDRDDVKNLVRLVSALLLTKRYEFRYHMAVDDALETYKYLREQIDQRKKSRKAKN